MKQTWDNEIYQKDFYLWSQKTVELLRERKFSELDIENLIEEIESMGKSEKRELVSRLIVLLMHLLKWKYQPEKRSSSWIATINEQRRQIELLLEDSPSLKSVLEKSFDPSYQKARNDAASETNLAIGIFPEKSPFKIEDAIGSGFPE
jgi:hypothetical protein